MDLEQLPPNKPNFKLILGLFCATIVILLLAAYFFLGHDHMRLPNGNPSRLQLPNAPQTLEG